MGRSIVDKTSGSFWGIGVEFFRNKVVRLGMELAYDAAEVEFEKIGYYYNDDVTTEKIKPCGATLSVLQN